VGGRMSTDRVDGMVIDRGAQFPWSAYSVLPGLARELGLPEWVPVSRPRGGISRSRRLRQVHGARPLSMVSSGLIDPLSLLRLGYHHWRMKRGIAGLSLTDYGDWHGFDDEDALSWSLRRFGVRATNDLMETIQHAFFFHGLRGNSRAALLVQMAFRYRRPITVAVPG